MWSLSRIMNENKDETYRRWIKGRWVKLSKTEHDLLASVCDPEDLRETFSCIGGAETVKEVVQRSIVLPFQNPELYPADSLRAPPKGVLLYGPPGTGKTLVAKAIAKSCSAAFIEVRVEALFGKWLGQSEQTVAAIFSLGRKLQPSIIFVDEMDSLLCRRDSGDSHAYSNAKTIFLRQWDGFGTSEVSHRVVVVGATNCPEVLDPAVLRRLPVKLRLDLPSESERAEILQILLSREDISKLDLSTLAELTESFSGSDLRELCKQALLLMVEAEVERRNNNGGTDQRTPQLEIEFFLEALEIVRANSTFVSELRS